MLSPNEYSHESNAYGFAWVTTHRAGYLSRRARFFVERFNQLRYREAGIDTAFVQDNHSHSRHGVLRGLHFQRRRPQGKLVWVVRGRVYDVAVDVRHGSPTFARWEGVIPDDSDCRQLYIPPGFVHGFCALSDSAEFVYKCTTYYDPQDGGDVE